MSIRQKGASWIVEVYDPQTKRKQHVKAADHGMGVPRSERQAKALERAALNSRDAVTGGSLGENLRELIVDVDPPMTKIWVMD